MREAYARMEILDQRRSGLNDGNSGGGMKGLRNVAAAVLSLIGFALLAACGGGSGQLSITLTTPTGVFTVDESENGVSPEPSIILNAAVGGDTKNQGVTWSILKQSNSGCSGTGTGPGQCGTLTNSSPFQVTYTPPSDLAATLSVTITATSISDPGLQKTQAISVVLPPTFTLTGCNPPSPPINTPCVLPNGKNGVPYTSNGTSAVTIAFTGGVSPYNFNQPVLPCGLQMTLSTTALSATITGTPCGSGTTQFSVIVTDSGGAAPVSQLYSISISPAPALSVVAAPLPPGLTNTQYSASVVAQGGVPPLTWTLSPPPATSLPPGIAFNTATGAFSGVPQAKAALGSSCTPAVAGTYCFTVQVQDSALPTHQVAPPAPEPLSITIQTPPPLQITTASPLTSGETAQGYTAQLQATGGVAPYTWSVTQGQLPAGLSLVTNADSTATISGTPILTGDSTFTVQVTDSEVVPATKTMVYSISITANTTSPTVNDALLQGTYAYFFDGFDKNGTVMVVGTFTADGKGNITSGTQDSNRISGVATGATISTGTYSIGADGRGTLELTSTFANQSPLTVDYRVVLDSTGGGRFFEDQPAKTDGDALQTHGEGVLKPVQGSGFANASFAGNYAFLFPGQDLNKKPAALAGVVHANGSSATITPGTSDLNDAGTFSSGSLTGTFGVLAGNRGSASLTFPLPKGQATLNFVFTFVSPSDLYFLECDSNGTSICAPGTPTQYRLGGEMILQSPNAVFNNSALTGTSVVSGIGLNSSSNSDVFAGLLTATSCDGTTQINLSYDENSGGTLSSPSSGGTCTMGLNGNGRVSFSFTAFTAAQTKVAAAYLTGLGTGFVLGSDAAVTTGLLEQQSGGPSFTDGSVLGSYALSAPMIAETQVKNVIGQLVGDGSGDFIQTDTSGDTVSVVDEIDPPATSAPNLDQQLSATLAGLPSSGRGTLTTGAPVPNGFPATAVFYVVSPSSIRMISTDTSDQHPNLFFLNH